MRRLVLLGIIFFGFLAQAGAEFNFVEKTSKTNSCVVSVDRVYYISGETYNKTLYDEFLSTSGDKYISDSRTTISMWEANNNLVSSCNQASAWKKKSDVAPNNVAVVATAANCTFNKPTDKTKRNVQFVYNIGYSKILNTGTSGSATKFYIPTNTFLNSPNDFQYKTYQNYKSEAEGIHGNECFNVELRYCGDGILDTGNGETCDPEDALKRGWGNGGCNVNSCQPINNPTCDQLTVTPNSGNAPLDVVAACTGYKVNTWKIDCGNGQIFTGSGSNAGTQTFSKTCKYVDGDKTYTPQCFINGTITGNSCKKSVTVNAVPEPNILIDKRDANVFDIDGNVGNDTQTVYSGSGATFKIRVTNNGNEALKNLLLTDAIAPACASQAGAFVNLSTKTFLNAEGNNVNITVNGSGSHTNTTLEVGEWFEYTCKKPNATSNYTNTAGISGIGVESGKNTSDTDPTDVKVVVVYHPEISVIKRDANTDDLDGNVGGNDSQTVALGSGAVFQIIVRNTGDEDLKNVVLKDAMAQSCATKTGTYVDFANKKFTNTENSNVVISVSGMGNHTDALFQVGEIFTYTCSKANTTAAYTNVVDVSGIGVNSGNNVEDTDPTEIVLAYEPAIQIVKEDANSNDLDGIQFNDTQTVVQGTAAVFHLTVKNTGREDLKNISLTDINAPACATQSGSFVNLSGKKFTNTSGVQVTITFDGLGNHNDAILQIGEEFTYTCEKSNTQTNYVNTAGVKGVGVNSGKDVTDTDPTNVLVQAGVYDLALRKTLSSTTPAPFSSGSNVAFDIRVYNQGNIEAKNIELSDYIPTGFKLNDANWTQSGSTAKRTIASIAAGSSVNVTIRFIVTANTGTITNFAEISNDDGSDCDSTPDSVNGNQSGETTTTGMVDDDIGSGCNSGGDEDDHDLASITLGNVTSLYDLALRKTLSSTTPGPFRKGDSVEFVIAVYNQGNIEAKNIEVSDYIPTGLTLNDATWTQSGNIAKKNIPSIAPGASVNLTIRFTIASNAPKTIKNLAEISNDDGDDCDSTPDSNASNDGTVTDNAIGTGCEPGGDEDDHDPEQIEVEDGTSDSYDLALRKTLSSTTPGPFSVGSTVRFDILVKNQGNVDALNVQISDYIPTGLTLSDTNWIQVGTTAQRTLSSLRAGQEITVSIAFTIASGAPNTITNIAEISNDDGDDCDSTPDTNATNDGTVTDNAIGTGCEPGGDEDDHDPETITVGATSACINLNASPTSAKNSLTSTLTCTGSGATSYKIEVRNSSNTLIQSFSTASASITLSSVGTYTAKCFVNNETTAIPACTQTLEVKNEGGSSGDTPQCVGNTQSGSSVYCLGNGDVESMYLNCNGVIQSAVNTRSTSELRGLGINFGTAATYAKFSCNSDTYQCYVDGSNVTSDPNWFDRQAWRSSAQCRETDGSSGGRCGNGIIESGEQCDFGDRNGKPGVACSNTCKLNDTRPSNCTTGDEVCPVTTPRDGKLELGPVGNIIVGHGQNPYVKFNNGKPYLYNNSPYDFQFDKFCVVRVSDASLKGGDAQGKYCMNLKAGTSTETDGIIYGHEKIILDEVYDANIFTADKNGIGTKAYGSGFLSATVEDEGFLHTNSYFAGKLQVRVAKPTVITVGGGTSYVKNSQTTGDVGKVTAGLTKYEDNKNFVGTSVGGDSAISSYSTGTSSVGANTKANSDNSSYNTTVKDATPTTTTVATQTVTTFTEKYNGLENVYIVRGKNVEISSLPTPTEATTYIVEGGNLNIKTNIDVSNNIAFIVKGGNITIDKTVTKLDGTYITIPVNGNGGFINGNGDTDTQIVIYGSVYGDMSDLVSERYYIDGTKSQLGVGTIVSFGSRIFHKPAPLVGQFIAEYLDATKIVK